MVGVGGEPTPGGLIAYIAKEYITINYIAKEGKLIGWALIGEDFFIAISNEEELKKALKEVEGKKNFEVVELKHGWNRGLESLEKNVLNNSEILLKYPFFNKRVKQENITIQEYVLNYLKKKLEIIEDTANKIKASIAVKLKKFNGEIIEIPEKSVEIKPEAIRELIDFFKFRHLLVFYNLIQEKAQEEIKRTPKIKGISRFPANSIFTNLQNLNKEIIKESKTKVVFRAEGLNTSQVAIMLSLYYAILYCISEGINQEDNRTFSFNLDNLMEIIGLPKRRWGKKENKNRGYSNEQKEEVLWLLGNVIGQPLRGEIKSMNEEGRETIKKLLGTDVSNSDILFFNPFAVFYSVLYDGERGYTKNANIKVVLHPLFSPHGIYTFKTNIFKSKLDDPHYRIFAIWLANGKRLGKKIRTSPEEVFRVAEIDIDYVHPNRTRERFKKLLERAKKEGIIEDYKVEGRYEDSFKDWLRSQYIIFFNKEGGDKKK